MTENMATARLGFIRVSGTTWERKLPGLRRFIEEMENVDVRQTPAPGTYADSKDIIGIHPAFDEIEVGAGPFVEYAYSLSDDGEVKILGRRV